MEFTASGALCRLRALLANIGIAGVGKFNAKAFRRGHAEVCLFPLLMMLAGVPGMGDGT